MNLRFSPGTGYFSSARVPTTLAPNKDQYKWIRLNFNAVKATAKWACDWIDAHDHSSKQDAFACQHDFQEWKAEEQQRWLRLADSQALKHTLSEMLKLRRTQTNDEIAVSWWPCIRICQTLRQESPTQLRIGKLGSIACSPIDTLPTTARIKYIEIFLCPNHWRAVLQLDITPLNRADLDAWADSTPTTEALEVIRELYNRVKARHNSSQAA